MIGHAGTLVHLVRQFLVADGDLYARISERGRLFRPYPKDIHHVIDRHHVRLLVYTFFVHLNAGNPGRRMFGLVPGLACFSVVGFQFLQSEKFVLVRLDKLQIRTAALLFGGNVHTGKPPVLIQFLLLETVKDALYRLTLPAIGGCRAVHMADQIKETRLFLSLFLLQPLMSALVVVHDLVRLVTANLHGHAIGVILRLEVLVITDVITQQNLAVGIHHLVHHRGAHIPVLVLIIQVQFRTVAIPKRVAA